MQARTHRKHRLYRLTYKENVESNQTDIAGLGTPGLVLCRLWAHATATPEVLSLAALHLLFLKIHRAKSTVLPFRRLAKLTPFPILMRQTVQFPGPLEGTAVPVRWLAAISPWTPECIL